MKIEEKRMYPFHVLRTCDADEDMLIGTVFLQRLKNKQHMDKLTSSNIINPTKISFIAFII